MPPPLELAELSLTVQLVSVAVLRYARTPPPTSEELPLTVQLVSVAAPFSMNTPPPLPVVLPPVIVSPKIDALAPGATWNTRLALLAFTATPAAGPVIDVAPVLSVRSICVPDRVIVCGAAKT